MAKVKLYVATPQSSSSGAAKGTASNPYTEAEFESMLNNGTWPGGYVQNLGYVMKEVVVSSSYPDSGVVDSDDSWTWSNPWDSSSNPWDSSSSPWDGTPWDGTDASGNNGNNNNGGSQGGGNPYPQDLRTFSGVARLYKLIEGIGIRSSFTYQCNVKITGYNMSISVSVFKQSFNDRDFWAAALVRHNGGAEQKYMLSYNPHGYIYQEGLTVIGDVSFELPKTGKVTVDLCIGYNHQTDSGHTGDSETIHIYPY